MKPTVGREGEGGSKDPPLVFQGPLVSTEWLNAHLAHPGVRILDASWYLPASGRDALAEYSGGHIPGAVYLDLDAVSDRSSPLPHMLPSAAHFARDIGALGIANVNPVVVYDGSGANMSAARAWWMFRVFGHPSVAVLDGGLKKWKSEGRPLDRGKVKPPPARFFARLDRSFVRTLDDMRRNLETNQEQVLDARSRGRFAGTEPEPRIGLRSGHLPGSLNLPFTELVAPDGSLLPGGRLRQRFEDAGVDFSRPVITTCGSGTTACALILGLHMLGYPEGSVYDGSWTEWGGMAGGPVETGPS